MPLDRALHELPRGVPDEPGIYEIAISRSRGIQVVYIGRGNDRRGIRQRVMDLVWGRTDANPELAAEIRRRPHAIWLRWRVDESAGHFGRGARSMEVAALKRFFLAHGAFPFFNTREEMIRDGLGDLWDHLASLRRRGAMSA